MRVLAVTPWFPTAGHPVSGVFTLRDAELLARNHTVTVLHLCRPDWADEPFLEIQDGLAVLRTPFAITKPLTYLSAMRRVRAELRGADLIHTMAFPALLLSMLVRPKLPWVHTEHFSVLVTPPTSFTSRLVRRVLLRAFRAPDETVAVGDTLAKVMDTFRQDKTHVIPNMVRFPSGRQRPSESSESGLIRMIAVGGLIDRKGPIQAVETVAALGQRGREAQLTWIGEGPLLEAAQTRAIELGITASCEWTGALQPAEVSEYLNSADLFILPVETETFGVAMAEALAHGIPVVTTGTGGHEEFLPKEASRVMKSRDPETLAQGVIDLIDDPNRWAPEQISRYAADLFSEGEREAAYARVYSSATQRHSENKPVS